MTLAVPRHPRLQCVLRIPIVLTPLVVFLTAALLPSNSHPSLYSAATPGSTPVKRAITVPSIPRTPMQPVARTARRHVAAMALPIPPSNNVMMATLVPTTVVPLNVCQNARLHLRLFLRPPSNFHLRRKIRDRRSEIGSLLSQADQTCPPSPMHPTFRPLPIPALPPCSS